MADDALTLSDRIKALIASGHTTPARPSTLTSVSASLPGFKFHPPDRVLDLVTGAHATVLAAYYGASRVGRVYEVQTDAGRIVVRVELELEPDRPAAVVPEPAQP